MWAWSSGSGFALMSSIWSLWTTLRKLRLVRLSGLSHGLGDQLSNCQGGQLDKCYGASIPVPCFRCDLQGQTCLTDPTCTHERQQTGRPEQSVDFGRLTFSAH